MTGTIAWRVAAASARGAAHVRDGRPNQDAIGWAPPGGSGQRIVAAVSDGHGGTPHFRSDRGARLAVARALEVLAWHGDEPGAPVAALPGDIASAWRAAVAADFASEPVETVPVAGATHAAYGATLIAVAATERSLTLLQIGDGDLMLVGTDGTVRRPLTDDAGLVGEETYSLCLDDAEEHFRVVGLDRSAEDWPAAVLIASDGVSKSFRDDAAFADAVSQLAARAAADLPSFAAELPDWLAQLSLHGSGDDASLCLVLRQSHEGDDR